MTHISHNVIRSVPSRRAISLVVACPHLSERPSVPCQFEFCTFNVVVVPQFWLHVSCARVSLLKCSSNVPVRSLVCLRCPEAFLSLRILEIAYLRILHTMITLWDEHELHMSDYVCFKYILTASFGSVWIRIVCSYGSVQVRTVVMSHWSQRWVTTDTPVRSSAIQVLWSHSVLPAYAAYVSIHLITNSRLL